MAKKSFDMDLNDEGNVVPVVTAETSVEVAPPEIPKLKAFPGDEIILPVPSFDAEGNPVTLCKSIESVTADEFLAWMQTVLPLPRETAERFIYLKAKSPGRGFENIKDRIAIFNTIVDLHDKRIMFGLGRPANRLGNN